MTLAGAGALVPVRTRRSALASDTEQVAALGAMGAAAWLGRERRRGAGETDGVW
jgi:hypothetical protein